MKLTFHAPRIDLPGRRPSAPAQDLVLGPGRAVVLLGRSGSGKTLLARLAAGAIPPAPLTISQGDLTIVSGEATAGLVLIGSTPGSDIGSLAAARGAGIGFVPQGGRENLVPGWSVARHFGGFDGREVLRRLGVEPSPANLSAVATELSEGMIRRVLLAVALARQPKILIVDEPASGLDAEARAAVADELRVAAHDGMGLLVTTHHADLAVRVATQFCLVEDGAIVAVADSLDHDGPFAPWARTLA